MAQIRFEQINSAGLFYPKTTYYVFDNLCGWTSPREYEEWKREPAYQARWAEVQAAYGADLDRILSPLDEWRKLGDVR